MPEVSYLPTGKPVRHKVKPNKKEGFSYYLCDKEVYVGTPDGSYLWREVTCLKCKQKGGRTAPFER